MKLKPGKPEEAGMSPARIEYIKQLAGSWVDEGVHPALVVLVARRGVICLHDAFGTLTSEPDSPRLAKDSILPIASATKPVTAACVMLLVEDGKVGLMRSVRDYFPEITAEGTDEVLVHHLLSHLSGWRDLDVERVVDRGRREGAEIRPPEPGQHPLVALYLSLASQTPLACRPGEAMQYCQLNFELLGDLVRRASGIPLERFARERIFEPLDMQDSNYVLPPEHRARKVRRAKGMPGTELPSPVVPSIDSEQFEAMPLGSAGMHSSAPDMAVFAQMLLNYGVYDGRRILSRASIEAMRRNHVPAGVPILWERLGPDGETITLEFAGGYGYGLFPFENNVNAYLNGGLAGPSSFGHVGAFGTYWWADPERDLLGVYLSVAARLQDEGDPMLSDWRADLFVDAVTAAVED